ncbi:DinB family protein [Deinococcus maricopensis]|uniref:DinB family protein n=1 Tax=Deinococcus maricopensis (strain DSM 21211 / LMG 22137 / NRRL B-23946 / LB-34) TaxID=709986 RepID=E8U3K2_DEIML|nr:DinB family protein [Deinococcus maricopensis]ADV68626.1 DinB family protein [Deinococcus maricopensis DSM 21211]
MSTEGYVRNFLMHRQALQDLLAQIPDNQGSFAAWDGGMSFIGLADHLSGSSARLFSMMRGQPPQPAPTSATLAEARQHLERTTDATVQALRGMTDEDLRRVIPAFGGREMPVRALVDFIIQHEAHHKGQVWMMARMIGLKPGMFVKL